MPIATQTIFGTAGLALILQAVWAVVGPEPAPIVVHSLAYEDGFIVQDRTVNSDGPFTAVWAAQVIDVATGEVVPGCSGSGSWEYQPGRKAPRIPLAEWVGNPACRLPPGEYQPMATYSAGEFHMSERGAAFEVTG